MADVSVDATNSLGTGRGVRTKAWVTADVGYWFSINSTADICYQKTEDGGATWGANVEFGPNDTDVCLDIWYDQWTPGDTGTLIHIWWFGSVATDDVTYITLDTADDSLSTLVQVHAGSTAVASRGAFVSGTKTRSGYLYCAFDIDAGGERGFYRSTDAGANWSSLDGDFVEAAIDECILFPASNTGDNNDCWAVYQDADADELTLKMWDSSAAAAVESSVIQAHTEITTDLTGQRGFSGTIRHSDGHLILTACSARSIIADHQVWDINGTGSITELTAITTDVDHHYFPAIYIDQSTNDIYVAYNGKRDGSETIGVSSKVYYTKSTDDGATWTAGDTAYMEDAAGVVLQVWTAIMGPRFYVGWRIGSTLLGNFTNSLDLSAVAAALEGTATLSISTSAALTTAIMLLGTSALSVTTAGVLTTSIPLLGTALLVINATGTLGPEAIAGGEGGIVILVRRRHR